MQIHITPRHLRLTAAIHQATASQVSLVEDLGIEIVGAHVVLMHDEAAKPADRYTVKIHLGISGPDIHAEQNAEDLYIALEKAVDKLCRQLRKRKTAMKDKRRSVTQRAIEREKNGEIESRAVKPKAAKKPAKRSAK
jgi:putative sigma-54 modulation protein